MFFTNVELYKKVFLIRTAEEMIISQYAKDAMKTPMHMSMGGEAISAGVCQALDLEDLVFGTYRSHALYISKTNDVDNFFCEMYGKKSNIASGKNGSMHLSSLDEGLLCCSAIVAGTIPAAVGAAFANNYKGSHNVVAVFFGDGATDEGSFWESLNFASLMKLPILFVYEDNGLAVHTFNAARRGFNSLLDIVSKFNINVFKEKAIDPEVVYTTTQLAVALMRETERPSFIQFSYHRYLEHVGVNEDYDAGYRSKNNYKYWYENDPVRVQRDKLKSIGLSEDEICKIENKLRCRIFDAISLAERTGLADTESVDTGVYR